MTIHRTAKIHPSAIINNGAVVGPNCEIGPFSVIGSDVILKNNVIIKSHVVISGMTTIDEETSVFPFASIGEIPQDLKYNGEKTSLFVGKRNKIRENVTMNPGTSGGGGLTTVGDDCLFMTGAHVGHDVKVGNRVVVANQSALAGHCIVDDDVIIGGLSGVHQFVRIGKGAIIGALTMVTNDVIPYGMVSGDRGSLRGLNIIGLKRKGISRSEISEIKIYFDKLFKGDGVLRENAQDILNLKPEISEIIDMVNFVLSQTDRSFLTMEKLVE
jgi:UDP-N-acetylglucosamine acyltransferase